LSHSQSSLNHYFFPEERGGKKVLKKKGEENSQQESTNQKSNPKVGKRAGGSKGIAGPMRKRVAPEGKKGGGVKKKGNIWWEEEIERVGRNCDGNIVDPVETPPGKREGNCK